MGLSEIGRAAIWMHVVKTRSARTTPTQATKPLLPQPRCFALMAAGRLGAGSRSGYSSAISSVGAGATALVGGGGGGATFGAGGGNDGFGATAAGGGDTFCTGGGAAAGCNSGVVTTVLHCGQRTCLPACCSAYVSTMRQFGQGVVRGIDVFSSRNG